MLGALIGCNEPEEDCVNTDLSQWCTHVWGTGASPPTDTGPCPTPDPAGADLVEIDGESYLRTIADSGPFGGTNHYFDPVTEAHIATVHYTDYTACNDDVVYWYGRRLTLF